MKATEFDSLLSWRLDKTRLMLASKATEYAADEDRLHSFKRAGELQRIEPEEALLGFMTKHIVSIIDMVLDVKHQPDMEKWHEKIGDTINYLCLLEALVHERHEEKRSAA